MYTCACKNRCMGTANHPNLKSPLTQSDAQEVARLMGALSTASRVRILARLRIEGCPVGELSAELEMEQPAVSHQLRVLRDLGLVVGRRSGRHVVYGLYDSHVASLLDEALRHIDHVSSAGAVPRRNGSASHVQLERENST
jgi:DNA-binding transcriptional ArsR family regulator